MLHEMPSGTELCRVNVCGYVECSWYAPSDYGDETKIKG